MAQYVQDTMDITLTRKSDDYKIFSGTTQNASLSQSVEEEAVKGGIGNGTLYTIKSGKELEIKVTDATFSKEWLAASAGVKVQEDQTTKILEKHVVEVGASGALSLADKTFSGDATVIDTKGTNHTVSVTSGEVASSELTVGKDVTVLIEKEVTGRTISIRADRFPEKYRAQLYTVVYDVDTEAIEEDLYITLENVTPSSETEINFEAGSAFTPEFTLKAAVDQKTKELAKYTFVKHVEGK